MNGKTLETLEFITKHFDKDSYERNLRFELLGSCIYYSNRQLLKPDAKPMLNLSNEKSEQSTSNKSRACRLKIGYFLKYVQVSLCHILSLY